MDPKCISYERLSDVSSSNLSETSPNKPNLEFTLGTPHWIYLFIYTTHFELIMDYISEKGFRYFLGKSERWKKEKKRWGKKKKRRAEERQGDKKDRCEPVRSISLYFIFVRECMRSNWSCMFCKRERERERTTYSIY